MKKIFLSIVLILALANQVRADTKATVASSLIGLGVSSHVASYLSDQITGNATLVNNQFLTVRNAADNANLDVLRANGSDATQLNTKSATSGILSVNGTSVVTWSSTAMTLTGQLTSSATADLGWSIVNAANQACNTTCTSACVLGFNTGALGNLLPCTDATADSCLCAGAS